MGYQQDLNPIWPQALRIHNYSHEEIRVKTGLSPMVKPTLFKFFLKISYIYLLYLVIFEIAWSNVSGFS